MTALLEPAAHLDGLVGADAAGDAERDRDAIIKTPSGSYSSILTTLRRRTSLCAIVIFLSPVFARHGAVQQLARALAGQDDELEPVFLRCSFHVSFMRTEGLPLHRRFADFYDVSV